MLMTIERVLILKTVSIFSSISDDYLAEVAEMVKEIHVKAGEPIIRKGDMGTSMFIIVKGEVRVHDGQQEMGSLRDREVFGELAALDTEPRSADVTASLDTHLFKLEQSDLYDLLNEFPEILRGVMFVLCKRIRSGRQA